MPDEEIKEGTEQESTEATSSEPVSESGEATGTPTEGEAII